MKILIKPWGEAKLSAFLVREEVFVKEQNVPIELELDELDETATHALAYQGVLCIGTGRLVELGNDQVQIGRMAVLVKYRGLGIGTKILEKLLNQAKTLGAKTVILHAQVTAIPFYKKLGFQTQGSSYLEAGIEHRNMILLLPN